MKVLINLFSHSTFPPKIVVDAGSVEEVRQKLELAALEYLDDIDSINSELSSDSTADDIRRIKYEPYTAKFGDILVWGGAFINVRYDFSLKESADTKLKGGGFVSEFVSTLYEYVAPQVEAIPDDTDVGYINTEHTYWAYEITEFLVGDDADV
ncbi:hypothetical protein Xoosp13_370 [Xanthomonas phage Xoo-sp13]|nr:hypothetical protein Xoosp13_370 [Xanthomonas phage Xoo-sp13]